MSKWNKLQLNLTIMLMLVFFPSQSTCMCLMHRRNAWLENRHACWVWFPKFPSLRLHTNIMAPIMSSSTDICFVKENFKPTVITGRTTQYWCTLIGTFIQSLHQHDMIISSSLNNLIIIKGHQKINKLLFHYYIKLRWIKVGVRPAGCLISLQIVVTT